MPVQQVPYRIRHSLLWTELGSLLQRDVMVRHAEATRNYSWVRFQETQCFGFSILDRELFSRLLHLPCLHSNQGLAPVRASDWTDMQARALNDFDCFARVLTSASLYRLKITQLSCTPLSLLCASFFSYASHILAVHTPRHGSGPVCRAWCCRFHMSIL